MLLQQRGSVIFSALDDLDRENFMVLLVLFLSELVQQLSYPMSELIIN